MSQRGLLKQARLLIRHVLPWGERGEICDRCGRDVGVVWEAPNSLWNGLIGRPNGVLCVRCFDLLARASGQFLRWRPEAL